MDSPKTKERAVGLGLTLLAIAILTSVTAASLAFAADFRPRFSSTRVAAAGLDVEVSWKENGLWPEQVVHNLATAQARATYVCLEPGQARASDQQNVYDFVIAEGDFTSKKTGDSSGKLTLKPPGPGMFSCPPGQRLQLVCAMYTQLSCRDDTYAISSGLGRTFVAFEPGYSDLCDLDFR